MVVNIKEIQQNINELPEEAQTLLMDFIELLKKRYSLAAKQEIKSETSVDNQASTLDILKQAGLIGCISAESDLSTNYKSVLQEALDTKYDNC